MLAQKAAVYLGVPEKDKILIPFKSVRTLLLPPDCQQVKGSRYAGMGGKEGLWMPPKRDWNELTVTKCWFGHQFLLFMGSGQPFPSQGSQWPHHLTPVQYISLRGAEKILENCSCSNSTTEERKCWHLHLFHEKGAVQASIRWVLSPFSLNEDKWSDTMKYPLPRTVIFQICLLVPPFLQHFLLAEYSP